MSLMMSSASVGSLRYSAAMASSWDLLRIVCPPLPVLPAAHRLGQVRILRAFVAAAQQQHHALPGNRVVDAVARADIDAQLPDPFTAELVVTEIAQLDPGHLADHGHLRLAVAQSLQPVRVQVSVIFGGQVMLDPVRHHFRL